jgi:hypothetical protein
MSKVLIVRKPPPYGHILVIRARENIVLNSVKNEGAQHYGKTNNLHIYFESKVNKYNLKSIKSHI